MRSPSRARACREKYEKLTMCSETGQVLPGVSGWGYDPDVPWPLSRRAFLAAMGATAGAVAVGGAAEGDAPQPTPPARIPMTTGYAPDGSAGRAAAFPVSQVRLLAGPFRENQRRNTTYLLFVDPDRLLRSFRLNYGLTSTARPCGGWEAPQI